MNEAMEKARETFGQFTKALKDMDDEKRYLLKMRIAEGDDVEHVWLEPVKLEKQEGEKSSGVVGVLAVKPFEIKKWKQGDVLRPKLDEISDWVIFSEDGSKKGGFTIDVLDKLEREAK